MPLLRHNPHAIIMAFGGGAETHMEAHMDSNISSLPGAILALALLAAPADARMSDERMTPFAKAAPRFIQTAQFVGPFGGGNLSPQPVYRPGYGYGQDFRPMVLPKYRQQPQQERQQKEERDANDAAH